MAIDQVELVKSSFASIRPVADAVAARFYSRLFALDPALRALFHADMFQQRHKFVQTLQAIVVALDHPALVVAEVAALGQRHTSYGVVGEHFALVEDALLWSLAQELGERWTPELAAAWRAAYTLVAATMQAAASSISHAPLGALQAPADQRAG